jgi:DNA relaxase NicK
MKSEQFARIYNKDAQSKEERYKNVWRYEVQLKNVLATKTAQIFAITEYTQAQQAAVFVRQWLERRSVSAPWRAENERTALPIDTPNPSDVESRLKWLTEQVRPTIQRLHKLGLDDIILVALGIDWRDNC